MAGPLIPRVSLIAFMPPTECAEFILKSAPPEMSGPSGLWKFNLGPIPGPKALAGKCSGPLGLRTMNRRTIIQINLVRVALTCRVETWVRHSGFWLAGRHS
jgi:hypothetical protein